jgi:hypothetical protein
VKRLTTFDGSAVRRFGGSGTVEQPNAPEEPAWSRFITRSSMLEARIYVTLKKSV